MTLKQITAFSILAFTLQCEAQNLFSKQGMFANYEPVVTQKLQKILPTNTVGEYPILTIGDDWQYLLSKVSYSTGNSVPLGRLIAFVASDKKHVATLDMTANLQEGGGSDWTDEPCKQDDFLWKRSAGGHFSNANCASINHVVNYFVNPTGEFQQLSVLIRDQGISPPPTILRVTFTRYSSAGRRLVYMVEINPDNYGIARGMATQWGGSEWHKAFIQRDPAKVEFVARLSKWAEAVQDRMDNAFLKKADSFAGLASLDIYLKAEKLKVPEQKSVEQQLMDMKSLFKNELLTESQYNEQVKSILNKQ